MSELTCICCNGTFSWYSNPHTCRICSNVCCSSCSPKEKWKKKELATNVRTCRKCSTRPEEVFQSDETKDFISKIKESHSQEIAKHSNQLLKLELLLKKETQQYKDNIEKLENENQRLTKYSIQCKDLEIKNKELIEMITKKDEDIEELKNYINVHIKEITDESNVKVAAEMDILANHISLLTMECNKLEERAKNAEEKLKINENERKDEFINKTILQEYQSMIECVDSKLRFAESRNQELESILTNNENRYQIIEIELRNCSCRNSEQFELNAKYKEAIEKEEICNQYIRQLENRIHEHEVNICIKEKEWNDVMGIMNTHLKESSEQIEHWERKIKESESRETDLERQLVTLITENDKLTEQVVQLECNLNAALKCMNMLNSHYSASVIMEDAALVI